MVKKAPIQSKLSSYFERITPASSGISTLNTSASVTAPTTIMESFFDAESDTSVSTDDSTFTSFDFDVRGTNDSVVMGPASPAVAVPSTVTLPTVASSVDHSGMASHLEAPLAGVIAGRSGEVQNTSLATGASDTGVSEQDTAGLFAIFLSRIGKDITTDKPTGQDICVFMSIFVGKLQPDYGKRSISESTYDSTLSDVKGHIKRHHNDFRLTHREAGVLKNMKEEFIKEGAVIFDPIQIVDPIPTTVARDMAIVHMRRALEFGTPDMNGVISRILILSLAVATSARPDEVAHLWPFDQDYNLKYEDVTLRIISSPAEPMKFFGQFKLPCTEGEMQHPRDRPTFEMESLNDRKDFLIDPINVIIILAMRTGNIDATTADELFFLASNNGNVMPWKNPQLPLVPTENTSMNTSSSDHPASASDLTRIIGDAAAWLGITELFASANIRAGAVNDLRRLPQIEHWENAGLMLYGSARMGNSRKMWRHYGRNVLKCRLDDRLTLMPHRSAVKPLPGFPLVREDPISPAETTDYIANHPEEFLDCLSAAEKHDKAQGHIRRQTLLDRVAVHKRALGQAMSAALTAARHPKLRASEQFNIQQPLSDSGQGPSAKKIKLSHPDTDAPPSTSTQIAPIAPSAVSAAPLPGSTGASQQEAELAQDFTPSSVMSEAEQAAFFDREREDVIVRLARYNLFTMSPHDAGQIPPGLLGGSRDAPTPFIHPCKNAGLGCPFTADQISVILDHESQCKKEGV